MSLGFLIKKREDVSRLDVINAIVSTIPEVTFVNIDDPYMLLGLKDKSLRGVVIQENETEWEVMVPSTASYSDYTLFHSILKTMSSELDLPLLIPQPLIESGFDDDDFDAFDDEDDEDDLDDDFDDDLDQARDFDDEEEDDFSSEDDFGPEEEDEIDDNSNDQLVEIPFDDIESHFFYPGWERDTVIRELGMLRALVCFSGTSAISQGLFHSFCIGPWLFSQFGISVEPSSPESSVDFGDISTFAEMLRQSTPDLADGILPMSVSFLSNRIISLALSDDEATRGLKLMDYLARMQWRYNGCEDTSSEMRAINPELHPEIIRGEFNPDDDEDPTVYSKSISAISTERLQKGDFPLLIAYADLAAISYNDDADTQPTVLIPFESLSNILEGKRIDDMQFVIENPLDKRMADRIMRIAPLFVPRDIFSTPEWPGFGYSDRQKTYVLMWNPEISSVRMEDFRKMVGEMRTLRMNWSINEHEEARIGDRFYLVCCGGKHQGMVASGVLNSNPYRGEDWSGKGREVWYVDLTPNVMIDPYSDEAVSLDELTITMPDFNWHGGHSGRLLSEEYAKSVNTLWRNNILSWINDVGHRGPEGYLKVNIIFR